MTWGYIFASKSNTNQINIYAFRSHGIQVLDMTDDEDDDDDDDDDEEEDSDDDGQVNSLFE